MSKIHDILHTVWTTALDAISDDFRNKDGVLNEDAYKGYKSATMKRQEQAILAVVNEAIGRTETEYSNLDGDAGYWEKHGRNQLRAEIRTRLGIGTEGQD